MDRVPQPLDISPNTLISLINSEVGINVEGVQKLPKSINVEVGITVEGGILWKNQ